MKNKFFSLLALSMLLVSCNDDDAPTTAAPSQLKLNLTGLENLGANFKYEGWIVVNGAPVTTGTFTVNDAGVLSKTSFDVDATTLANATKFVLSIEPAVDTDSAPSNTKYLVGDFSGNSATVNSGIVGDFATATGKYLIASPSSMSMMDPFAGVWFINGANGSAGLSLPTLESGWKYEGWVVKNGTVLSTGKFSNPAIADESGAYSGTLASPPFPGEDFIVNAPTGVTFPWDLSSSTLVISVEPVPDNSSMPFTLKPLSHNVSATPSEGATVDMTRSLMSFPTGTVTR
jgi:hypothetical protein